MKKIIVLILLTLIINPIAGEEIYIDNLDIQEYKGRFGKWILIDSKSSLISLSKKFLTPIIDIYRLNGKKISGKFAFIPYSDKYLHKLKAEGKKRTLINNSPNDFIWPIAETVRITSVLGLRNGRFHPGLDIPAGRGTPVIASMEGRVIFSGYASGYGKTVLLEHRNNFITRYSHHSANLVKRGDFVRKGQIIGFVGSTGNSTGNHLHFEIRSNRIPLDPLDFLPENKNLQIVHTLKNWK